LESLSSLLEFAPEFAPKMKATIVFFGLLPARLAVVIFSLLPARLAAAPAAANDGVFRSSTITSGDAPPTRSSMEGMLQEMQSATGEVTPTFDALTTSPCRVHDWLGLCRDGESEEAAPLPTFEEALTTSPEIRLPPHCQVDWSTEWLSHQTTNWMRVRLDEVEGETFDDLIKAQMPGAVMNHDIVITTSIGTTMTFSEMKLVDIAPVNIEYAVCWDSYEWWQQQMFPVQLYHIRPPDGIQVAITGIDSHISFDFVAEQNLGLFALPLGSGSGTVKIRGLLVMDANLHTIRTQAIDRCEGKFDAVDMVLSHNVVSSNVLSGLVKRCMPGFTDRVGPLFCYGREEGTGVASAIDPTVSFENVEETVEWRGLVAEINDVVRENTDLLSVLGMGDTPPSDRLSAAIVDQQRLKEVGVETVLGEGRFVHVDAQPPPVRIAGFVAEGGRSQVMDGVLAHHASTRSDVGEWQAPRLENAASSSTAADEGLAAGAPGVHDEMTNHDEAVAAGR